MTNLDSLLDELLPRRFSLLDALLPARRYGGEGSGNWGHEGRPGEVGGSLPTGISNDEGDITPAELEASRSRIRADADRIVGAQGLEARIADIRARVADGVQTKVVYTDHAGNYTPERTLLHNEIINDAFADTTPVEHPTVVFMGGLPGAGKSHIVKTMGLTNFVRIDADAFREKLPDYKGWNAALTQRETDDIVGKALAKATAEKRNVILDVTLKNYAKHELLMQRFKELGYRAGIVYVELPPDKSIERALERYLTQPSSSGTGRFVDPYYIASHDGLNSRSYRRLKSSSDFYRLYNTDVARGVPPILKESSGSI
jgi:predicted kinase